MSGRLLTGAELAFIRRVAARRYADQASAAAALDEDAAAAANAFRRAALVGASMLSGSNGRVAALLAVCCQLSADGYQLVAPQGAAAGMIAALASDDVDVAGLARWLEDRAVPAGDPW